MADESSARVRVPGLGEWDDRHTFGTVVLVSVLALAARLVGLGSRVFHWDEGRVGYDILRYMATGWWEYRPIVHGPFLPHVNKYVFTLVGANDFTARAVVAVVGSLLPLSALLFRDRLRDSETVALAALLSFNPILLYYSRFMRNDVLVGAFAFIALGLFVRAYDRRQPRYLYGASVALALSFTAKENALIYVLCFLGGGALLLDHRLFRASEAPKGERPADDAEPSTPSSATPSETMTVRESPARPGEDVDSPLGDAGEDETATGGSVDEEEDTGEDAADEGGDVTDEGGDATDEGGDVTNNGEDAADDEDGEDDRLETDGGRSTDDIGFQVQTEGFDPDGVPDETGDGASNDGLTRTDPPHDWTDELKAYARATYRGVLGWYPQLLVSALLFLGVITFFFAPRAGAPGEVGLWNAFRTPSLFPAVLEEALVGSVEKLGTWTSGSHQDHPYLPYLKHFRDVLFEAAAPLLAFAVLGFVADRYSGDGPRDVVALGGYWGGVSILGYPVITDIQAGWATVHAVIPLALPAAVGLALLFRWGRDAYAADDHVGAVLAVVVLLLTAGVVGATATNLVYQNDQADSNPLVQYGQPAGELKPTLADIETAVSGHSGGPDVLFYGNHFYVENESEAYRPPIDNNGGIEDNGNWYHRLPLPWYLERYNATTASTQNTTGFESLTDPRPPVIITRKCTGHWDAGDQQCVGRNNREFVRERVSGYRATEHQLTTPGTWTVFFVRTDLLPGGQNATATAATRAP